MFDDLENLTEVYSNNELKWKYTFEGGLLTSINQGLNLSKSYTYYDNNYLKSVREGSNLIEYAYKGSEYISQVKYTVGLQSPTVIDYSLDDVYRLKEIKKNGQSIPEVSFDYSLDGLPSAISYSNGSSMSMKYDRSRLSSYTMKSKLSTVFDAYAFEYDENQNINKITSNVGITEYEYDELNQLKTEKLPDGNRLSYEYDDVGNRKEKSTITAGARSSTTYEYNDANQLIKVGNQNYQYDHNGNLTFDGTKTYEFNNFNQLEAIKNLSGNKLASYTYDEEGKRKSMTTYEGTAEKTVRYYYDGDQVLYETDGKNNVLREYTYDSNGNPLTMTMEGESYYYLINYHGDVMALTDSTGNVVASYTYDAWGNILSQNGVLAEINPYRYASYRYDENTNLYYLMARYYNPDNGVFLTVDPARGELENPLTLNGYNYVNNNPVMMVDPDGQKAKTARYINLSTKYVGIGIDIALTAIPGGITLKSMYQLNKLKYVSSFKLRQVVDKAIKKIKINATTTVLNTLVNSILIAMGSSIGTVIAQTLDRIDGKYNGKITIRYW